MAQFPSTHSTKPIDAPIDAPAGEPAGNGTPVDRAPDASSQPDAGRPSADDGLSSAGSTQPPSPALIDQAKTVISTRPVEGQSSNPSTASPLEMGMALQGQRLDHFELREFVGGGGMGAVFRALDTQLDRVVAVKVLSRDQTDEESLRRFKNEAQSAARLDHPNIARVYYVGQDRGWNYIVFEFIEGINIRDLVEQKGPLSLDESVHYCLQMAEALEHAFRREVVHRDIKPSNVLVLPDGKAKLVDMGLARLHQVESPSGDMTASGVTLGTFDYISPEQALDPRNADVRSDLYSLGCTFYFMLTARPPFAEGTVLQKLLRHSSDEPPDPRLYRADLPDEILSILNKLLSKQPKMRYQEPSELIGELILAADRLGLRTAGRGGTVWIAPSPSRFWTWEHHLPAAASVLALMALVATVFVVDWALRSRETPIGAIPRPVLPRDSAVPATGIVPIPGPSTSKGETSPGSGGSATDGAASTASAASNSAGNSGGQGTSQPTVTTAGTGATGSQHDASGNATETALLVGSPRAEAPPSGMIGLASIEGAASVDSSLARLGPAMVRLAAADFVGSIGMPPDDLNADSVDGTAPAAPLAPRLVVVGPGDSVIGADEALVGSLAAAIDLAQETPGLDTIELRTDGPLHESPLDLAIDDLTIRAASGFHPLIVFSPDDHALAADREMIRVAGGNLTMEGVHLWMRLPWEPADGWALFQLDQTRMVELRSCTLTIENADAFGSSLQDRVAFFEVQSPSPQMDVGGVPARTSPPAISMVQTIARGRATLVHAAQVCPFRLTWSQGLFVSSEWMIEAGGATTSLQESMVEVDLQHVTAQLGQGLCRMEGRPSAPYLLYLDVDCSDCIFVTGTAAPLIEHVGLPGDGDMKEPFKLRGEGNFYPEMNIVWRAVPSDSSFAAMEYGRESRDDKWSPEQFLRSRMILWNPRSGGEDRSLHQRDKGDYLLLDHPSNPALHSAEGHGKAGFDAALMPDAPESAEPPATNRDRAAPKGADGATSATRGNAAPTTAGDAAPKTADRAITDRVDRAALKGADRAASVIEDSATPARPADTPRSAASSAVEVRMEVRMEVAPDPARDTDSAPVSPRP